jgi:hypothetical protein
MHDGAIRTRGRFMSEPRHHGEAVVQRASPRLFHQVVRSHNQAAEPVLRVNGSRRDSARVQDGHGCFHHGPEPNLFGGM